MKIWPTTKTEEDRVLLERFRSALERISVALGMPGSPDLAVDVPRMVEELLSIDDVNWRAREEAFESWLMRRTQK